MLGIPLTSQALKASVLLNIGQTLLMAAVLGGAYVWVSGEKLEAANARAATAEAKAELAAARQEIAEERQAIAEERAAAVARAQEDERAHAAEVAALEQKALQEKRDAQARHDRLVSDLRNQQQRLRKQWLDDCPAAGAGGPAGAADAAAGADGAPDVRGPTEGRILGVGRAIAIGAACDRHVKELQGHVVSLVTACAGEAASPIHSALPQFQESAHELHPLRQRLREFPPESRPVGAGAH